MLGCNFSEVCSFGFKEVDFIDEFGGELVHIEDVGGEIFIFGEMPFPLELVLLNRFFLLVVFQEVQWDGDVFHIFDFAEGRSIEHPPESLLGFVVGEVMEFGDLLGCLFGELFMNFI